MHWPYFILILEHASINVKRIDENTLQKATYTTIMVQKYNGHFNFLVCFEVPLFDISVLKFKRCLEGYLKLFLNGEDHSEYS